jgi:hypothetical protein
MTAISRTSGSFDIRPSLTGRAKAFGLAVLYLAAVALLAAAFIFGMAAIGFVPAIRITHLALPQALLRGGPRAGMLPSLRTHADRVSVGTSRCTGQSDVMRLRLIG